MRCVYIKSTLFKKEWEQLEKYYFRGEKNKEKKHTRDEANFYYSKLKDLSDDIFLKTIDNVYKNCKYFPCIAEIREQIPNCQEIVMNEWKDLKYEPLSEEDKEWARGFYKKYCETEKEYHEKLIRNGL